MYRFLLILFLFLISCEKEQHDCVINKTGVFRVNNQSKDIVKFVLIQNKDTLTTYVDPYTKINYIIKAGVVTKTFTYRSDTLYRKTIDNWSLKRCELDGVVIVP